MSRDKDFGRKSRPGAQRHEGALWNAGIRCLDRMYLGRVDLFGSQGIGSRHFCFSHLQIPFYSPRYLIYTDDSPSTIAQLCCRSLNKPKHIDLSHKDGSI